MRTATRLMLGPHLAERPCIRSSDSDRTWGPQPKAQGIAYKLSGLPSPPGPGGAELPHLLLHAHGNECRREEAAGPGNALRVPLPDHGAAALPHLSPSPDLPALPHVSGPPHPLSPSPPHSAPLLSRPPLPPLLPLPTANEEGRGRVVRGGACSTFALHSKKSPNSGEAPETGPWFPFFSSTLSPSLFALFLTVDTFDPFLRRPYFPRNSWSFPTYLSFAWSQWTKGSGHPVGHGQSVPRLSFPDFIPVAIL